MNVSLTPELEKFVADKVATGRFGAASEVVRSALRTFEDDENWKAYAHATIKQGLRDRAEGKMISKETFLAEAKERRRKRA